MDVRIEGLDDILRNLSALNVDEDIENRALSKAGKITKEAIISEAPVAQGVLKKNIKLKRPRDGEAVIHTGGAYHAHLVEFGRSAGSIIAVKKGKRQKVTWGSTNPNPFFTRGFEKSKSEAQHAMADEIKKGLGL